MKKKISVNLDPNEIQKKLRGGYYTPAKISEFLVKWIKKTSPKKVLEPSCGDGQFIQSLVDEFGDNINIIGIELFPDEAKKSLNRGNKNTKIINSDVFEWYLENKPDGKFDAVVGNPPFIRYQNFPEEYRVKAFHLMKEELLSPTRLTNSWVPFVVLATRSLASGGLLALVLPAELLQVTYAQELRKYLSTKYTNLKIITFRQLVFPNIQQEVVILLGERGDCDASNMSFLELEDLSDLTNEQVFSYGSHHKIHNLNHDNEKWTQFYLSSKELDLIRSIEPSDTFIKLGDIAEVDVGVVTGNNKFFILNNETASTLNLLPFCSPIVGRSNHLSGIVFKQSDYTRLSKLGEKTLLLNVRKLTRDQLDEELYKYILHGENSGITEGYKCRIRLPHWWNMPSAWIPDAFLLRQIHGAPKLIANSTEATSTDTVHRVKMKKNVSPQLLSALFTNSLTFALAEIRGRSYGGGVLELEPSEAESLLIPFFNSTNILPLEEVDILLRKNNFIAALDMIDAIVLKKAGLTKKEIQILRDIWLKLKTRRNSRGKKNVRDEFQSYSSASSFSSIPAWGGSPLYRE